MIIHSGIGTGSLQVSGSFGVLGSSIFSGSVIVTEGITGSLFGTSSWASNAVTSSYALNAESASYSSTASSADNFLIRQSATASNLLVNNTITAQTLVVNIVSSSIIYSSGSNIFGNQLTDTQQLTGSVTVTGSLSLNNDPVVTSIPYNIFSSSIESRTTVLENASASFASDSGSNSTRLGRLESTASILVQASASFSASIAQLLEFSSSLDTGYVTEAELAAATSSLSASIAILSSSYESFTETYNTGSFTGSFSGYFSGSVNNIDGATNYIAKFDSNNTIDPSVIYQSASHIAINETAFTTDNPEALYVFQTHPTSINVLTGKGNLNHYLQNNIQNTNQGISASSDVVATANNGNEDVNYIDMGINSENYNQGFIGGPNDAYLYSIANNLHIGNANDNGTHVALFVGGTDVDANTKIQLNANNRHTMSGSLSLTGSLNVLEGITGSLFGTASWAITASHALSGNGQFTGFFAGNGSGLTNISASSVAGLNLSLIGSGSVTASTDPVYGFRVNSNSAITGSLIVTAGITGSLLGTASFANNATNAATASSANTFFVRQDVTASNALITGTITAQTLVVQTVTSSVVYSSGSTVFGNDLSNTQQFTGSVTITGSLAVNNDPVVTNIPYNAFSQSIQYRATELEATASILTTASASYAVVSASYASASGSLSTRVTTLENASASFASDSGSNSTRLGRLESTASVLTTASASFAIVSASYSSASSSLSIRTTDLEVTASVLTTASASFAVVSASYASASGSLSQRVNVLESASASFALDSGSNSTRLSHLESTASVLTTASASFASVSSSYASASGSLSIRVTDLESTASVLTTASASFASNSGSNSVRLSHLESTASILTTASASFALVSASFSSTSQSISNRVHIIEGNYATTGSNIFVGNQTVTGSLFTSGSNTLVGSTTLTGSLNVSGSTVQVGNNTLLGNTTLSGSIIISGTLGSTPSVKIYGDTQHNGYIRFDPVTTNIDTSISASYIFVSGSTQDLYFSQNNKGYSNVTRLRWLEGNLFTGLLNGGLITTQSSTVYQISSGSGIIVNLNASLNDNPYPVIQYLNWGNLSASIAPFTSSYQQAFVGIDSTNNIYAQGTPFSNGQFDTIINIGNVLFQNQSTINGVKTQPSTAYGFEQAQNVFNRAFGPLKLSGYTLAASGSSTGSLIVGSGTAYSPGSNYTIDPNEPYYTVDNGTTVSKIFRYYQSGSTWVYQTNAGAGFATIDPTQYSNNGTLTAVPAPAGSNWTIQRVYWFPNSVTKAIVVYYGNAYYGSESEAIANINIESFVEAPNTAANAIYLGAIVISGNGVFTNSATYKIVPGGLFRSVGGSGGGGSVVTQTLSGLSDVSISGPTNGQPLVYNTTSGKWQNSSTLTATLTGNASTATSASHALTSSYAITSSHTIQADTASYVLQAVSSSFATTASYVLNAISASYAATASSADDFVVRQNATASNLLVNNTITAQTLVVQTITSSVEFVTGSTIFGSLLTNTHEFTGSVSITGSLSLNNSPVITDSTLTPFSSSVSTRLVDLESTASILTTASASFAIVSSSYASASGSLSTRVTTLEQASASFALDSGSNSTRLTALESTASVLTTASASFATDSGSNSIRLTDLELTASVLTTASASFALVSSSYSAFTLSYNTGSFTGSFTGDGSGLINIPASGIVGLNLSQIASGSATASISPVEGFRINTNTEITGSLIVTAGITGSLLGTASYAISSSTAIQATTASYVLNAVSASYALTASYTLNVTGSVNFLAKFTGSTGNNVVDSIVSDNGKNISVNGVTVGTDGAPNSTNNLIFGYGAMPSGTSSNSNVAIGDYTLENISTGNGNVGVGLMSLRNITTGYNNTAIGTDAGRYEPGPSPISTNNTSVFVGNFTRASSNGNTNEIVIGDSAIGNGSNTVTLGNTSITRTILRGGVEATSFTGSLFGTATDANNATNAATASSADTFIVRQDVTASNALITGTITAQTLVVQTVTSSVLYSSGSNVFGNDLTNTQQFTGSVTVTGSLSLNNSPVVTDSTLTPFSSSVSTRLVKLENASASLASDSGSNSVRLTNLESTSSALTTASASFALVSSSYSAFSQSYNTGSFTGSFTGTLIGTASWAENSLTSSYVLNAVSASYALTAATSSYPINVLGTTLYSVKPLSGTNFSQANSIFLGENAGDLASNAGYSTFLGYSAGQGATNAGTSNFIGYEAGRNATGADQSNFIGQNAGDEAFQAGNANFIGNYAGQAAYAAVYSNFIGEIAGYSASYAEYSNFVGYQAGYEATSGTGLQGADLSNFIGYEAGYQSRFARLSNFIGRFAGKQATFASNANFIGDSAGELATDAAYSVFIGGSAGYNAPKAEYSNFIGQQSGVQATSASYSNFIGNNAGNSATNANNSNFIGYYAGNQAANASYSNLIGYRVADSINIGSNNIIVGTNIALPAGTKDSINLGGIIFATGSYSDALGTTLTDAVGYGRVGINVVSPIYNLDVSGSGNYTNGLTITGSLTTTGSVVFKGLTSASYGNVVSYDIATGQLYYQATGSGGGGSSVTASYALTASAATEFTVRNTITLGSAMSDYATVASSVAGSNNLFTQAVGSYTSGFFKYTVTNGANARSGEVMSVWNGSTVQYTDNSTLDIGTTTPVTCSVSIVGSDVQFNVQTNTSGWTIKSLATYM